MTDAAAAVCDQGARNGYIQAKQQEREKMAVVTTSVIRFVEDAPHGHFWHLHAHLYVPKIGTLGAPTKVLRPLL